MNKYDDTDYQIEREESIEYEEASVYANKFAIMQKQIDEKEKRIKELEEERDQWHGCFIVTMENSIPKQKVKNLIKDETINISGFECIAVEDIEKLVEDK